MTYNVTALYGNGPIGFAHQLNVLSNYIALDVVIVVVYVVLFGILSGRQASSKNTILVTTWVGFIFTAVITFGVTAFTSVDSTAMSAYVSRLIVTLAIAISALLWHMLSGD